MCKLQDYIALHYPSDIEIILVDADGGAYCIHTHKCILGSKILYFHNLFRFGKESSQKSIRINVSNAIVAYDLIMESIENKPNSIERAPKYLLERFKCRQYFCLNNDAKLLHNIKIEPDDFELLLEVIEQFELDPNLLYCIKKNMPLDYDLDKLSMELINELAKTYDDSSNILDKDVSIKMYNYLGNKLICVGNNECVIKSVSLSPDLTKIAISHTNMLQIRDTNTFQLLGSWSIAQCHHSIKYSPDGVKMLIIGHAIINILDTETGVLLLDLKNVPNLMMSVLFTTDASQIIYVDGENNINICNASNGHVENVLTTGHTSWVNDLAISPDGSKLVSVSDDNTIKLWDMTSYQLINSATLLSLTYRPMCLTTKLTYFPDNLKYASNDYNNISVWDAQTGNLIITFDVKLPFPYKKFNITVSSDSSVIAYYDSKNIIILNSTTGKEIYRIPNENNARYVLFMNSCSAVEEKLRSYFKLQ